MATAVYVREHSSYKKEYLLFSACVYVCVTAKCNEFIHSFNVRSVSTDTRIMDDKQGHTGFQLLLIIGLTQLTCPWLLKSHAFCVNKNYQLILKEMILNNY